MKPGETVGIADVARLSDKESTEISAKLSEILENTTSTYEWIGACMEYAKQCEPRIAIAVGLECYKRYCILTQEGNEWDRS